MDRMTREERHRNMSAVRSKDTVPEKMLRLALWHRGLRYRKNYKKLPGTPDIALTRQKIAIFVDGDFWHAHGHEEHPGEQIRTNPDFWRRKLMRNVERDKFVNDALLEMGWLVMRFWESDIKQNLPDCVEAVMSYC